jgi:2-polyprenyl-3-methyl-5-hydroxy-6-metoxy-1,4-benzoquinol methylase
MKIKEENIRPESLIKEYKKLFKDDLSRFLKDKHTFIIVNCPACNSKHYKSAFKKRGFSYVNCSNCNTLFVNPRPTPKLLTKFYTKSKSIEYWNKIYSSTEEFRRKKIFIPRVKQIIKFCKKYKILHLSAMDVGAGYGTFCEELSKTKYFKKIIAVEPSKTQSDTCKKKGIRVLTKPIENIPTQSADLITNFELIEHLFDPKSFVQNCAKSLSKNGIFVLTTPNSDGFDISVLGKLSDNVIAPNHLNLFNEFSIKHLLTNCGFEILEYNTPGKFDAELVRKKILDGEYKNPNPFFKRILIEKWDELGETFQNFLIKNNLSSNMWIVARKK